MIDLLLKESAGDSIKWHLDVKCLSQAFLHACMEKNSNLMEVLLARGAEVNEVDSKGRTPLLIAAQRGDIDQARFLLNRKANVNASPDIRMHTALTLASSRGHLEMVDLLLTAGADVNAVTLNGNSPAQYLQAEYEFIEFLFRQCSIEFCRCARRVGDCEPIIAK